MEKNLLALGSVVEHMKFLVKSPTSSPKSTSNFILCYLALTKIALHQPQSEILSPKSKKKVTCSLRPISVRREGCNLLQ